MYFTANYDNIASHRDLFKTDPNDYAKYALGTYGNDPKDLTVANGKLFFTADDFNLRRELFKTDGVTDISNPTPIKDINPATTTGDVTFPTEAAKRILSEPLPDFIFLPITAQQDLNCGALTVPPQAPTW